MTSLLEQPLGTALKIAGGLFGIWVVFMVIRRVIARQKAKKQVEGLITQEESENGKESIMSQVMSMRTEKSHMAQHFGKFQKILAQSALKNQGDPMYVLPWFLMLGSEGSGKTSMLSHARLPAPLFNTEELSNDSCTWWPYNHAIIIDPVKNYISKDKSASDEWNDLLKVLDKNRKKEPLNGVVLTINANHLLESDETELFEEGRQHQARIDELMKKLKIKIPIYLMVTKCNKVEGFEDYAQALSLEERNQVMGYTQEKDEFNASQLIPKSMEKITERVKDLLLNEINQSGVSHKLLRLPRNLQNLENKLMIFCNGAFQENPFQENPFLRGIFLSGLEGETTNDQAGKGIFIQDFFTRILPGDRSMLGSLTAVERAGIIMRRLYMGAWSLGIGALIGGLYMVNSGNLGFIQQMTSEYAGAFVMKDSIDEKVKSMASMEKMIKTIDYEVSTWWVPWFGVFEQPGFIEKMKTIYAERFRQNLMNPLNESLNTALIKSEVEMAEGKISEADILRNTARQVDTFVRRLNTMDAYFKGNSFEALQELPAPFAEGGLYFPSGTNVDFLATFNALYLHSLSWSKDEGLLKEEREWLRQSLTSKLEKVSKDLQWIIPLANDEVRSADQLHLKFYWGGTKEMEQDIFIPSAYTLEGKEFVEGFINRLVQTDPDSEVFKEMQALFTESYRKAYLDAWENFSLQFDSGMKMLAGRGEYIDTIDVISTRHNPYFKALDVFTEQLEPFLDENAPEWLTFMDYYQQMKVYGPEEEGGNNKVLAKLAMKAVGALGPVGKAIAKGGKSGMKTQKKLAKGSKSGEELDVVLEQAGGLLTDYKKALMDVSFNSSKPAVSFRSMQAYFANPDEPGAGEGPDATAYKTILKLQTLIGKESRASRAFWKLYIGPMEIVYEYMLNEAACMLQNQWRNAFLVEIEGVPKFKLGGLMFGEGGQLWNFINENGTMFIVRQYGKGYVPAVVRERKIPFTNEFVNFVSILLSSDPL
ncbi:MAG: hypothetical protein HQM12_23485 [SAR324 cluster bacterium]|nr:hypothetical protein [SAR324 cluster bacterium]